MGLFTPVVYRDAAHAGNIAAGALASLSCDVSFISDDSAPPHVTVAREIERRQSTQAATLFWNIFDRMRGEYEAGGFLPHPTWVTTRIQHALAATSIQLSAEQFQQVFRFFDRVNEVMFQQQTLAWLIGSEFKVHAYGAGWENHPTFAAQARGVIENDAMRLAVYRASRVNLFAGVYGAVSPGLTEAIAAGGFALMRFCPADLLERFFPPIVEFCSSMSITSNAALAELATPGVRALLAYAGRTIGVDILQQWPDFIPHIRAAADARYTRCAASLWAQYPAVTFGTRDELIGLVAKYLYDVPERMRLAEEMRRQLNARFAHVRINPRVLSTAPPHHEEVAA